MDRTRLFGPFRRTAMTDEPGRDPLPDLGVYFGGPKDGERVEIIGTLQPSEIGDRANDPGVYRWDGARYAWQETPQ